jgi:pSer/pThr/pTyr-binding forkhead associated (FHA) protein
VVDLNRPSDKSTPYIILESLNSEKNSSRTIHTVTINTDQTCFSLGRGHDSELRINDISVSRKHASLEYKDGNFLLTDLKSKFGTLMLMSEGVELSEGSNSTFQIGRTIVTIKAKSETPWRKRHHGGASALDVNCKGEELQKMEELLRGTKSLANRKNTDNNLPRERKRANPAGVSNDLEIDHIESDAGEKKYLEIDGVRYVILKELDDGQNELNGE